MIIAILISISLMIVVAMLNDFFFNGIANTLLPFVLITTSVIGIFHSESNTFYTYAMRALVLGIAIYLAIPNYTISEANHTIQREIPEAISIKQIDNIRTGPDGWNPFKVRAFYQFMITDSDGIEYLLIFNPNNGDIVQG